MSKPYKHALTDVKKFGGKVEDYLPIHDFMDSTKSSVPDVRHRAILHSSFGIFIVEKVFGHNITNSDGKVISVRDIAERHCIQDLGTIPTMQDWLSELPIRSWMSKPDKNVEEMKLEDLDEEKTLADFYKNRTKKKDREQIPMFPGSPWYPIVPIFPNKFDMID